MKELVSIEHVERVLQVLGIAAPFCGLLIGAIVGWTRKRLVPSTIGGLMMGLTGTAVFGMWRVFHLMGRHSGYASISFIGGQIVLFLGVGLLAGAMVQRSKYSSLGRETSFEKAKSTQEETLNA